MTPQQRATQELRSRGYIVDVVERISRVNGRTWRNDLFGGFDLLAVGGPTGADTLAVQVTSRSNVAARVNKVAGLEAVPYLRKCGWSLAVWGWGPTKTKGNWLMVDVS